MGGLSEKIVHPYEDLIMNIIYFIYCFLVIFIGVVVMGLFYLSIISLGMIVRGIKNLIQIIHNLFDKITKHDSVDI